MLAENLIATGGAVVSEFPLSTPPLPQHFPRRNRIISGLSKGVLVIEAALRSGSLVTARCALEQGRDVFALPGPIGSPGSEGTHWLIKQGHACDDAGGYSGKFAIRLTLVANYGGKFTLFTKSG